MGGGGDDKESGEDYGYEQTDQDYKYDDKYDGSGKSRSFVWVIVIICVAMLGVAGAYFWFIRKDNASVAALSANISEGDTTGLVLSADSLASDSLQALSGDTLAFVADAGGEEGGEDSKKQVAAPVYTPSRASTPTRAQPTQPTRAQPTQPIRSTQPTQPVRPTQPARPTRPTQSTQYGSTSSSSGGVEVLSQPTGRSYIVIGSFSTQSRAERFASRFSSSGERIVIIPPHRQHRYYRVSVSNYGTSGQAIRSLGQYKSRYGHDIWVYRY